MKLTLALLLAAASVSASTHQDVAWAWHQHVARHLQTSTEFDVLCEIVQEDTLEATCVCDAATRSISCESNEETCQNGSCFKTTSAFTLAEDLMNIESLNVCVDYSKGAPNGFESGCVDLILEDGLLSDCDLTFGGVTCNSCSICSSTDDLQGSIDIDCANVDGALSTDGCRPFSEPANLFSSGGVSATTGMLAAMVAVGAILM